MKPFNWLERDAAYPIAWALLILAVVLCTSPSLDGPFLYDDTSLVRDNERISRLSNFSQWFDTMLLGEDESSRYYRPVLLAAFAFDRAIWATNTFGYHLTNLAWHLVNVLLMAALCRRLGWDRWAAWLAAALFALHPLNAQAVCYISGRGDVQFLGLSLLACHAALSAWKSPARALSWNLAAGALFAAALLTREMAALVLIWVPMIGWLSRTYWSRMARTLGFLGAALVLVLALRWHATDPAVPISEPIPFPPLLVLLLFFRAIGFYAAHLAVPVDLALDRSIIAPTPLHHFYFVLGIVLAAMAIYAGWRFLRAGDRPALFCLAWTCLSFLPVSNLIRLSATASDQWIYPASIGLFGGAALLASRAWPRLPPSGRQVLVLLLALTLGAWGLRLFARSLDWSSGLALYRANLEQGVVTTRILNNYGLELARAGRPEEALQSFDKAIELDSRNLSARANHAMILCALGQKTRAESELKNLTREFPEYQQAWVDLMLLHHEDPDQVKSIGAEALATGKEFPKVRAILDRTLTPRPAGGRD